VLIAAGENALAHAAPDEAARWFQRALDEAAADPPAAEILSLLGTTEAALRDPAGKAHLEAALAHAMDPALRSRTAVTLAEAVCMSGRWSDAFTVVAAARQEIGEEDPEALAALAAIGHMLAAYAPRSIDELALDPERVEALSRGPGWGAHALAAVLAALAAHRGEGVERVAELVDGRLDRRARRGARLSRMDSRAPGRPRGGGGRGARRDRRRHGHRHADGRGQRVLLPRRCHPRASEPR
jgi:hypothetical protein